MKVSPWSAWKARLIVVAFCAIVGTRQARTAENDKVTLVKNKEAVTGKITKDDKDGLEMEVGGGARRTFNSAEIADVDWDISTEGFRDAVNSFRSGSYSTAAEGLQAIIDQKEVLDQVRAVARPYLLYLYAECKFRSGKAQEAAAGYQRLISTYANSRYTPMALTNMADAAIQSKAFDKLPALLAHLREGGPDQKQMADYFEGEALMAQNKPAEALKKYANAATGIVPRVKAMALVGQARCLIAAGDAAKARDAAQAALNLTPPDSVSAMAHTIIGDAIVAEADAKKTTGTPLQDALLDAVLEYLRVQNQYPTDARTEGYAVLRAGECFKRLSKLPGRAAGEDQARAVALFSRLSGDRRFANTDFPNKASKFLDEMK